MPYKDPEKARESARLRQRTYRQRHPERISESNRRQRAKDPAAHALRLRLWREANPDKVREYARAHTAETAQRGAAWQQANPDKVAAKHRRWRERNPEAYQRAMRRSREKRRETRRQEFARWAAANPDKVRMIAARRRARKLGSWVEDVLPGVVFERANGVCGICGESVDRNRFHVDHIIPLARGGEHSYANVQLAHPLCNARKWAHLPEQVSLQQPGAVTPTLSE